jgi:hypothetical protein
MNQSEPIIKGNKSFSFLWPLFVLFAFIAIMVGLFQYSQSLIRVDAPEPDLGEKVIITLSGGNIVYTYENFLIEEDGKLFYKGERNKIDLTGGKVVYENWE